MLKLNAGFSRKVGESNFGSRGASVNVELELESHLINDPDGLRSRISGLFDLARRSVDDELKSQSPAPGNTNNNGNRSGNPSCYHRWQPFVKSLFGLPTDVRDVTTTI